MIAAGRHRILTMVLVAVLGAMVLAAPVAHAQPPAPIAGSGSTWAQNAIEQWRRNVNALFGIVVNYAGTGSTQGRFDFRNGLVDFAVSELEYGLSPTDPPPARPFAYLPLVAGGLGLMYNLQIGGSRVTTLRLSGDTVARIFTRAITRWDDPAIQADNPGLALPALAIVPVVRSDGTGTSLQLTQWFAERHAAVWADFCARAGLSPCQPTTNYPMMSGLQAKPLSVGVANFVQQASSVGAITYVENSYARNAGFPEASLRNDAGVYVAPTAGNVSTALRTVSIRPDLTQDLTPVYSNPDPNSYPLSSYAYAIVPTATQAGFGPAEGRTLSQFLSYAVCAGQNISDPLGYAPLPPNLVQEAARQIARIPGTQSTPDCVPQLPAQQTIVTEILPGALTITVVSPGVTLPPPVLTADARMLTTGGQLNPVRVTDTRAGNPGWNLSGQINDFTDGSGNQINGANLGWTPELIASSAPAQTVTVGPVVEPGQALLPGTDPPPGLGLRTARTMANAATGAGTGTADITATLALTLPTSTPAGIYTATLTLTVI